MPRKDPLAKQVVAASLELYRRRSWTKVPPDAPFLIRVPGEEEPLSACLIGQDGTELGVALIQGPDAFAKMRRTFLEGASPDGGLDACDCLMLSFERLGAIPEELRGVLQAAGFQARRENIAPYLSSKPAHRQLRALNRGEMRTLAWCLRGILAAEDRGELRPVEYRPEARKPRIFELDVEGKPNAPQVTTRFVKLPAAGVATDTGPVLLPRDLGDLPRCGESWIAGLNLVPGRIEDDPRTFCALLILDADSELVIGTDIVPGEDMNAAVASLVETLRKRGLPRELTFTSELLMAAAASGLAAIGVPSHLDSEEALWWDTASHLTAALEEMDPDDRPAAEPESLEDWKEADVEVIQDLVGDLLARELLGSRATKRYFGSEETAASVRRELDQLAVTPAFIEWFVADYRATKRSRTYVEKRLERKRLDPVERALLEARRDAYLSFFRVVSCRPGESLDIEDLLGDQRFTVQERSLSTSGLEGWYLPLRVMRVGEWHFPVIAGPPVNAIRIDRVLSRLEQLGLTLEPAAMRADAHLLGRTWTWFLEDRARPLVLQNTDGDPLVWHTAEFHIDDPRTFVRALEARDDVLVDDPGAEWTWARPGGPNGIGDTTTLCRLELFDDSLVATVNSARRLETARTWLESLPGVRFVSVQRADPDDPSDPSHPGQRPGDDRLPGPPPEPLTPDVREHLEQLIEQHYVRWLDEPIPALDNQTPRAACATEPGRRRVKRLIRTMPPMQTPGGEIPAPRERLLSELGL